MVCQHPLLETHEKQLGTLQHIHWFTRLVFWIYLSNGLLRENLSLSYQFRSSLPGIFPVDPVDSRRILGLSTGGFRFRNIAK
jgi:hypothetical protein